FELYFGSSRCAQPLPRGHTGHVAHPVRSIVPSGRRCGCVAATRLRFFTACPVATGATSVAYREDCRQALTVFAINIAIVIGPTPPGTGVIADAFSDTSAKAT